MKALKLAGVAIGAVIVVIVLLLVIGVPSGFLTAQIQERVERETGYKLAINGGARIGLWPSLNITLNDVTLQHPADRDINRHFAAASIEADVTLASLVGQAAYHRTRPHSPGGKFAAAARARAERQPSLEARY